MKKLSLVLCIFFAATFLISGCARRHHERKGSLSGEMKGSPKGADCCGEEKCSPGKEKKGS